MPEWLIEHGIGEDRALLVEGTDVLAARLRWPGELHAGRLIEARLVHVNAKGRRGTARDDQGREILVDHLPSDVTEGATARLRITRAAISERGRFKRAVGRVESTDQDQEPMDPATPVRRLPPGAWEEVWELASAGEVHFPGGSLIFSVTPAMTLIDIDGDMPARDLGQAAVEPLARALRLFDLGGSIGIDFPTLESKADRKAVDFALESALTGWPHERTAMNGFGFIQLVTRLSGPSLLHRFATARAGMAARLALRRAEMTEGPGVTLLTLHPALKAKVKTEWLAELEGRTGRPVRMQFDPALAIEAPQAQLVPS